MGFLAPFRKADAPPELTGHGLTLRFPALDDQAAWSGLRRASRSFLEPWEPTWSQDELSIAAFRQRIRRYRELFADDKCYPFFLFAGSEILGAVTLSNVRRGVAQTATLGYWIGAAHARKGHMSRALAVLLPHAFDDLGLHRVEAACLPRNEASVRLLRCSGFEQEGYAKRYLEINGIWEDHLLFARLAE